MFTVSRKELIWAGRPLVIEAGKIARQADGAVMVTYGETTVLCTAVAQKAPRVGIAGAELKGLFMMVPG